MAATALLFTAGVASVSAQSMVAFFDYNESEALKAISLAAHPSNDFIYGTVFPGKEYVEIWITTEGWILSEIKTKFKLYKKGAFFTHIEVFSDDDPYPAFRASNDFKNFVLDMLEDAYPDTIDEIEDFYGEDLYDLTAQQLCCAYLSYLL